MYWFTRPPYLRWAAAGVLLVSSVIVELRPAPLVEHPFVRHRVEAGTEITESDVVWRKLPTGLIPPVELPFVSDRVLYEGDPVLTSPETARPLLPEGWWAVELSTPAGLSTGVEVRVVVDAGFGANPLVVPGIILEPTQGDTFGDPTALVGVPEEWAGQVAVASSQGGVSVLVGAHR